MEPNGRIERKPACTLPVCDLKNVVCLLSCQPRDVASQLPEVLDYLGSSVDALAVGIWWPDARGRLRPLLHRPSHSRLDAAMQQRLAGLAGSDELTWGQDPKPWLAAPMKVGGTPVGWLWAVTGWRSGFEPAERDFITMAGNQVALALENSRLYDEVEQLAARRGRLLGRVIAAQDERCRHISRELHDEISQSLAAMALDLEAVQVAGSAAREAALERLSSMRDRILMALVEVNRIILDLRPTLLEDKGLVAALHWYAGQRLEPLGVRVHLRSAGMNDRLQPHVETTMYRIAQEAVTNVAKHSGAHNLWLTAKSSTRHFTLSIRDDGHGFDPPLVLSSADSRVGIGLFGMKERASLVGGSVDIQSAIGRGTSVVVRVPLEAEAELSDDSGLAG